MRRIRVALLAFPLFSLACGDPQLAGPGAGRAGSPPARTAAASPGTGPAAPAEGEAPADEPLELDIADLRQTAADWPATLEKMRQDLAEVESFHLSGQVPPLLKLEAWERYLQVYAEDVPFSHQDDLLRQTARGHIEDLRLRTRFVDFGDGTVVDTVRGKMWTKRGIDVALRHAAEHCGNLTFGLGRYQDWRLPELTELVDLYDSSSAEAVKILGGIELSSYRGGVWSAKSFSGCRQSSQRGSPCPAFLFEDGRQEQYEYAGQVLCVREQSWPMASPPATGG